MRPKQALAFVREHGLVLESGRGRPASRGRPALPSLAEAIAGAPIRGSWWAHPESHAIFRLLGAVRGSEDVLACRLVDGKVTLVHRRLWPALVAAAPRLAAGRLAAIRERHTPGGRHVVESTPFPRWVPAGIRAAARALDADQALAALAAAGFAAPARSRR
ncbi:MAG TPA: hypothetical protein VFD43_03695, partial [Planctomycetota bacterium]|nr:hypothetical protein [Planctomycetota bacterium]